MAQVVNIARTKYNSKAGPDGGDGGRGDHIILKGNAQLWTLLHCVTTKMCWQKMVKTAAKNNSTGRFWKRYNHRSAAGYYCKEMRKAATKVEILEDGQEVIWLKGGVVV